MEIRLTYHAARRMLDNGVTRDQVESVLAEARTVAIGASAVEYDGEVGGRTLHVVVARDSQPPLVVTVWWVRDREE